MREIGSWRCGKDVSSTFITKKGLVSSASGGVSNAEVNYGKQTTITLQEGPWFSATVFNGKGCTGRSDLITYEFDEKNYHDAAKDLDIGQYSGL